MTAPHTPDGNAGCDRCGMHDRAEGSKFCAGCAPHTPGRLAVKPTAGHETHGQHAIWPEDEGPAVAIVFDGPRDAGRIAACWNALLPLTLEQIERLGAVIARGTLEI